MDTEKFISLLNEDLATEYQSIVQYVTHIATIRGAEYQSLAAELEAHLGQELEHALTLARQIDFLGGTPGTDVPKVAAHEDTKSALQADLELEEHQLERYRERVSEAEELDLPDVAEVLSPILEQTQDHVRDLRTALG